jgi:hypothetical protein
MTWQLVSGRKPARSSQLPFRRMAGLVLPWAKSPVRSTLMCRAFIFTKKARSPFGDRAKLRLESTCAEGFGLERSLFKTAECKVTLSALLKSYNTIIKECENDPSLFIKIPE